MFSTLEYAKHLEAGGVPREQAEAHATAQGGLVVDPLLEQLATKEDMRALAGTVDVLAGHVVDLRGRMSDLEVRMSGMEGQISGMEDAISGMVTKKEFDARMDGLVSKEYLEVRLDLLEKKMTIRLGGLILVALAALSALNRGAVNAARLVSAVGNNAESVRVVFGFLPGGTLPPNRPSVANCWMKTVRGRECSAKR